MYDVKETRNKRDDSRRSIEEEEADDEDEKMDSYEMSCSLCIRMSPSQLDLMLYKEQVNECAAGKSP